MYFDTFAEFLVMDGHGVFVWSAYAITVAVFLFNVIVPVISRRRFFQVQKQALRREEARESN